MDKRITNEKSSHHLHIIINNRGMMTLLFHVFPIAFAIIRYFFVILQIG